ncbi:MAG: hypothetical protein DRQ88_03695 [Epsilonproteobacteria bacterium]|nr:MAG: hypothetical protein DRQ89_03795 [Campylobacterota bacterium]RLA67278.1 MAG: hypothetical protein DRQ88_03695 [Campylobacterota bacterium]
MRFILSFFLTFKAFGAITCTHPQVCNLFTGEKNFPLRTNVDPHHFEPTLKEIKTLMKADILVLAPLEISPWAQKIAKKRIGKTYTLKTPPKFFTKYQTKNSEALAHFWIYPDILCHQSKELMGTGLDLAELNCSVKKLQEKTSKLTKLIGGKKVIITHDALGPLFSFYGAQVLALVSAEHGYRPSIITYKKLTDWQKSKEPIIWILEKDIKTNKRILQKIASSDIKIKVDITGNIGQDPFFIWDALIKELESNLYAKPNP